MAETMSGKNLVIMFFDFKFNPSPICLHGKVRQKEKLLMFWFHFTEADVLSIISDTVLTGNQEAMSSTVENSMIDAWSKDVSVITTLSNIYDV